MRDAPLTPPYDNFCTFIDPSTNLVFDVTSLAAATLALQAAYDWDIVKVSLMVHLREHPDAIMAGLETIARTTRGRAAHQL